MAVCRSIFFMQTIVISDQKRYNKTQGYIEKKKNGVDKMKVSREELLHIAKLADLNIKDEEIEKYLLNLQDILNFANLVNNAPVEGLEETCGVNENYNVLEKMK